MRRLCSWPIGEPGLGYPQRLLRPVSVVHLAAYKDLDRDSECFLSPRRARSDHERYVEATNYRVDVLSQVADIFIITDVPGKGKGLVAARQLRRGDLILAESHLFAQKIGYTLATIVAALSQLSKDEQRAYFSLSNAYPEASPPLGVWVTNSFPCWSPEDPTGESAGTAGVFLTASRFNGSCHPNVYHHLDPESHRMVFRAVTDIAAGEELCITYCDILATRHERQAELKESFRFECCCIACSRTGQEVRRSDDRRTRLARLFYELPDCKHDPILGLRKVRS